MTFKELSIKRHNKRLKREALLESRRKSGFYNRGISLKEPAIIKSDIIKISWFKKFINWVKSLLYVCNRKAS